MARIRPETAGLIGLLAVVSAAFLACRGSRSEGPPEATPPPASTTSGPADLGGTGAAAAGPATPVLRVVDGDTFHVLHRGRDVTIRLIGIDTPEVGWYGGRPECHGARAGLFVRDLLQGERVRLEFDVDRTDPYGRTLAYAYLEDGRMLNLLLVRRGFAEVTIYPPNDRHRERLLAAEDVARSGNRGLWSACR